MAQCGCGFGGKVRERKKRDENLWATSLTSSRESYQESNTQFNDDTTVLLLKDALLEEDRIKNQDGT